MSWIGWAILSAVFAAATALLAKVGVAHVDSNLAMALRTSVVVVFAWAIVFAFARSEIAATGFTHGAWTEIRTLDRRTLLFLALSGLATGLSWLCYFRALQLGLPRRPHRQAQRPPRHRFCMAIAGRKAYPSSPHRRPAHHRRSSGHRAGMTLCVECSTPRSSSKAEDTHRLS
jgi:uncharacterized membrane protein